MALTAIRFANDQDTLRNVLIGEAGNQGLQGQTAVANVIYNRAALNEASPGSFPGGDTAVGVATAPYQFQASGNYLAHATPSQIATADQAIANAQSGNNDPTMGATYYANPNTSTPGNWGSQLNSSNSVKIGAHYFTDNTDGLPFSGNPAVAADGTVTPSNVPTTSAASPGDFPVSGLQPSYGDAAATGTDKNGNPAYPPTQNALTGQTGGTVGGIGNTNNSEYGTVAKAISATTPVAIATGADEQSAQSAANTKALDDTATANTKAVTGTATSIYGLTFGTLGDGAMRVALVVTGLILLAGALYLVASEQGAGLVKRVAAMA